MPLQNFMMEEDILILKESPSSLKEVIEASFSLLIKKNKITSEYLKAIYDSHERLGSYYVVAPKVAIPHSRPENGVLEQGVQVTIFKGGADFQNEENGLVYLSVAFASLEAESHMQLISEIASLLEKVKVVEEIITKETSLEIWQVISQQKN